MASDGTPTLKNPLFQHLNLKSVTHRHSNLKKALFEHLSLIWFNLGSSIASKIKFALFFANCDILGVKIIRIDPLEPNIWLTYMYYAVLELFCNPTSFLRRSKRQLFFMKHGE